MSPWAFATAVISSPHGLERELPPPVLERVSLMSSRVSLGRALSTRENRPESEGKWIARLVSRRTSLVIAIPSLVIGVTSFVIAIRSLVIEVPSFVVELTSYANGEYLSVESPRR